MIPEQKLKIYYSYPYEISVTKVSKKQYKYCFYDDGDIKERFTGDKAPDELNKTTNFVKSIISYLSEQNIYVESVEGDKIPITKESITQKVMKCFNDLQDTIITYISRKEEHDAERKEKELQERNDKLFKEAEELCELLDESNVSLFTFLTVLCEWQNSGELKNTLIGVLCHLSTYFGIKPVWFLPVGKAGEGKSMIDKSAQTLLPEDAFISGRITEAAMHRETNISGNDYLDCKIMTMNDMGGKADFEKWKDTIDRYKELTSEGKTSFKIVGDGTDENGERKTIEFEIEGYCSVAMTTIHSEYFDDQILSRGITVTPEANDEQVRLFSRYNKGAVADKREQIKEHFVKKFHNYVDFVKSECQNIRVINPYWDCLEDWFKGSEYYKRNLDMYPSLVETVTVLHYNFRDKIVSSDGTVYLVATKEDNRIIAELFNPGMGLSADAINIFNLMLKWYNVVEDIDEKIGKHVPYKDFKVYENAAQSQYREYSEGVGTNLKDFPNIFSVADVKQRGSKTKRYRKLPYGDIINSLVNMGLVNVVGKMGRGNNNVHSLGTLEPIIQTEINFDENVINRYVRELSIVYGVTPSPLLEIINNEITENDSVGFIEGLELPPWVSKVPHGYRKAPFLDVLSSLEVSESTTKYHQGNGADVGVESK